jgi:hypothetical protein
MQLILQFLLCSTRFYESFDFTRLARATLKATGIMQDQVRVFGSCERLPDSFDGSSSPEITDANLFWSEINDILL